MAGRQGGSTGRAGRGPRPLPARVAGVLAASVLAVLGAAAAPAAGAATPAPARPQAVDPALFAPGSCEILPPTGPSRHRTVFLDAGHGGVDPGAVGTTASGQVVEEADATLPVELYTASLLRARGFTVAVSRTTDGTVARLSPGDLDGTLLTAAAAHDDVVARDRCADLARADILVGIYFDAAGNPDAAGSLTAFDAARPFWLANLRLATLVQHDVLAQLDAKGWQIPDDGVQTDDQLGGPPLTAGGAAYGHLLLLGPPLAGFQPSPSTMPGALVEPLFVTDPFEAAVAASAAGQQAIARGLAQAVEAYFAAPTR